jgi:monoamine oxidase
MNANRFASGLAGMRQARQETKQTLHYTLSIIQSQVGGRPAEASNAFSRMQDRDKIIPLIKVSIPRF